MQRARLRPKPCGMNATSSTDKLTTLYVSPIKGSILAVFLITLGLALAALPHYLMFVTPSATATPLTAILALVFLALGAVFIWPGFQFARAIVLRKPLATTDGVTIHRMRLGLGTTEFEWEHVGELVVRGVWLILLDGRIPQSRFTRFMFGAKGLWIPSLFVYGGGRKVMQFIMDYRPDLIDPMLKRLNRSKK